MKKFNVILATDMEGGMGLNNRLPWNLSVDFKFFKDITKNNVYGNLSNEFNILIMGRKTWESLDKKCLSNRENYVISSQYNELNNLNYVGTRFFKNFNDAYLEAIKNERIEIWVIGGRQIYDIALKHWGCGNIYWTQIMGIFKADTFVKMEEYNIKWQTFINKLDKNLNDNKEYILVFKKGILDSNVEIQYLEVLNDILLNGEKRMTRNGITYSKFNKTLSWDLEKGFPLLTTKKMFWKGIVEELLFFIRGETNSKLLSNNGIKIWEPNTSKEFLDKLGFNYNEGEMGPMYGYQWRFFNKPYPETEENKNNKGIDQLVKIIDEIKKDPYSRRILMTDFNPSQVELGVLYPCHSIIIQFYVQYGKLNCSMYQRSGDLFLGIPFNIASTSLLVHIIAQLTMLKPGNVNLIIGDYHIYDEHINAVSEQLTRTPFNLPSLEIPLFTSLNEVEKSSFEDYKILNYQSHSPIKAKMIA